MLFSLVAFQSVCSTLQSTTLVYYGILFNKYVCRFQKAKFEIFFYCHLKFNLKTYLK